MLKHLAATILAALVVTGPADAQPKRKSVAPQPMQDIAPGLAAYTDDVLFGDVWVRPQLKPRDRSLVTLSVLIATGKGAQLAAHLKRGLDNGVTPLELSGMATQLAFYTGWPNAVTAIAGIEPILVERGVDLAALRAASDRPPAPATGAPRAPNAAIAAVAPKFDALTTDVIYGDLWHRTDLTPRDRSLVTIAALAANGDEPQLESHLRRGLANGLTRAELGEALTHLAFYAGWPKANSALRLLAAAPAAAEAPVPAAPKLTLTPPDKDPAPGPASNFTGKVAAASRFKGSGDSRLGGATVTFAPGAHTNWHTHPLGQLLIVTKGAGWVQTEGEPVRAIAPGDVVWTAPGVRHWHGATRTSAMTHTAVAEAKDGETVTWMEPVADADYHGPR